LAGQMLSAIAYLHDHMIMHRDIKAENFMLTGDSITSTVKLIDFGMAAPFQRGEIFTEICGSTNYMAPELLQLQYNHMVDMWAFGVLIYLLVFGRYPFKVSSPESLKMKIAGPINWTPRSTLMLMPATLDFMMAMLEQNPGNRASSKQAQEHAFIQQVQVPDESIASSRGSLSELILQASGQESQERSSPQLTGVCCTESDIQDHVQISTAKARSKAKQLGAFTAVPGKVARFWRRKSPVFSTIQEAAFPEQSSVPLAMARESTPRIQEVLPCTIPGRVQDLSMLDLSMLVPPDLPTRPGKAGKLAPLERQMRHEAMVADANRDRIATTVAKPQPLQTMPRCFLRQQKAALSQS